MKLLEACREVIAIDSTPEHGSATMARWLFNHSQSLGLAPELINDRTGDLDQANIIDKMPLASEGLAQLMLQNHLDTSEPGPFPLWEKTGCNPFDAHIREGRIFGLGSAFCKIDFLCKLQAMSELKDIQDWKAAPIFVGTFGEETGMIGALRLIRKNRINARWALVGEPSQMNLIYAAKGIAQVEIRIPLSVQEMQAKEDHNLRESTATQAKIFSGKSAHCSDPSLGDSAIIKMFQYLKQLPDQLTILSMDGGSSPNSVPSHAFVELDFVPSGANSLTSKIKQVYSFIEELQSLLETHQDPRFVPSTSTLNIGTIRTFETEVVLKGTCRMPPTIAHETYEQWIDQMQKSCASVGAQFVVTDYKKSFQVQQESIFFKECLRALGSVGLEPGVMTQSSTNEASLFSRVGIECIGFGPGERVGNIYTPQESVSLASLEPTVQFYKEIIQRMCL